MVAALAAPLGPTGRPLSVNICLKVVEGLLQCAVMLCDARLNAELLAVHRNPHFSGVR